MSEDLREYESAARAMVDQYVSAKGAKLADSDLRAAKACIEAWLAEHPQRSGQKRNQAEIDPQSAERDRESRLRHQALAWANARHADPEAALMVAGKFLVFLRGDQPAE